MDLGKLRESILKPGLRIMASTTVTTFILPRDGIGIVRRK